MAEVVSTKPFWASETIWGAMGAIVASVFAAYTAYKAGNMELAMTSVGAAFSGVIAVIGRFKADSGVTLY
jgi:hypothetical protein